MDGGLADHSLVRGWLVRTTEVQAMHVSGLARLRYHLVSLDRGPPCVGQSRAGLSVRL